MLKLVLLQKEISAILHHNYQLADTAEKIEEW
jgi:hypothetical protein